jgi:hypothetical protein
LRAYVITLFVALILGLAVGAALAPSDDGVVDEKPLANTMVQ